MSYQHLLSLLCCVFIASGAYAQNLKPVKDKTTKKYGYQVKGNKTWVIAPSFDNAKKFTDGYAEVEIGGYTGLIDQDGAFLFAPEYDKIGKFDKFGYCELMRKTDGVKLHGVADRSGRIIIPLECRSVSVDSYGRFIYAKYDTALPGFRSDQLWGVYDTEGRRVFSPQFSVTPSFRDGIGIAKSARTGLYGMISGDGRVLKDFKYLTITRFSGGYKALGTDLSHTIWSEDLLSSQVLPHPGAVIPYDPQGDPVRAAAWHKGPVGIRLHRNTLKRAEIRMGYMGAQAWCSELPIDWGYGRFVRLEPCEVPAGTPDAMYYGSARRYYTLKALLYEADGRFVREICNRGWIEADCSEGAFYNAGGKEMWLILANPNALGMPMFTMDVHDYRPLQHTDIFTGLGLTIQEMSDLTRLYNFTELCRDIYEGENVGVCTYIPRIPSMTHARIERDASRAQIFHYPLRMGEVVNCKINRKNGIPELELSDDLVCRYKDKFEDPYYSMRGGDELIYWGPNNARTVVLRLEAASRSGNFTRDDIHGTDYSYRFVLDMFEEDGTWLRTLAEAPWIDYVIDGVIVFEPLGLALITPFTGRSQQQPQAQNPPQGHGHVVQNRNGKPARSAATEVHGGSRSSIGNASANEPASTKPSAGPAPLPAEPLPHTLSALEHALGY